MGYETPDFPNSIWDGLSLNTFRPTRQVNLPPSHHDWDRIVAEMIAVQQTVAAIGGTTDNPNVWNIETSEEITIGDFVFIRMDGLLQVADATQQPLVNGVALSNTLTGQIADILTHGKYINLNWSLTPGSPYYLRDNGSISDTPPVSGWVIQIGRAITTVGLSIEIKQPIKL